jgi:hypothetical protein
MMWSWSSGTMSSSKMEVKHLSSPDEVRKFENGKIELVKMGGGTIGRAKFEPGWRWSKHVKPIAKTDSCEAPHFQYHVSGVLHIVMNDGTARDVGPGEISLVPPGHDAWVVGNEPVVVVDFRGLTDYAKQSSKNSGSNRIKHWTRYPNRQFVRESAGSRKPQRE